MIKMSEMKDIMLRMMEFGFPINDFGNDILDTSGNDRRGGLSSQRFLENNVKELF